MKINWKLKLAIGLTIASAILYTIAYFGFHEPDKVIFYIVIDLAFIPLDILIVALVIESLIEKKERETVLEKLDMILGVFFSEIGDELLETFTKINASSDEIIKNLENIENWSKKDYQNAYKHLETKGVTFNPSIKEEEIPKYINELKGVFDGKREFLVGLIENPNILEKDSFSNLILAIFHLEDELKYRIQPEEVDIADFRHIVGDIDRVYSKLTLEWLKYLEFLNKHYPYMSSIALRTNPFNPNKDIHVHD